MGETLVKLKNLELHPSMTIIYIEANLILDNTISSANVIPFLHYYGFFSIVWLSYYIKEPFL